MEAVLNAVLDIIDAEEDPITIRHLYYRLVGLHVIEKTEQAYKGLCAHLSKWRRSEQVPWDAFTDNTRWHIHRRAFNSLDEALSNTVATYRRNLWTTQPHYIEVWVEKDAIASIVAAAANSFGVPVFVARGFASLSSVWSAANTFRDAAKRGKKCIIYHLGDYDPSGVAAGECLQRTFREDFEIDLQFTRIAVTREQITALALPTRPVKMSDRRAAKWTGGECVELDTMPPKEIKRLVESSITQHIDPRAWAVIQKEEEMERETLRSFQRMGPA